MNLNGTGSGGGSALSELSGGEEVAGHVFFICRVWGSRHGGSYYSQAMVAQLARTGWRVTVLAERFEQEFRNAVRLSGFFRRDVLSWCRKAADIVKLWRLVTKIPGSLVIVQGDLPRLTYLLLQLRVRLVFIRQDGLLACPGNNRFLPNSRKVCVKQMGLSCLLTHRREGCLGQLSWAKQIGRIVFRLRDHLLLCGIRHFVANSRYIARVHGRPAEVLHPPLLRTEVGPNEQPRDLTRLVFCGRLEPAKGAADAITILSRLPKRFHLEILGDGPDRERLNELAAKLRVSERVHFYGWVDPAVRDRWLQSAGVLLMPSLWDEAFGMAGIEAFAQGTPVVAYDVGGIGEWCHPGAGILVPCGDIIRAAHAVEELTQDVCRWQNYSETARSVVEQEFPRGRFGEEMAGILTNALNQPTELGFLKLRGTKTYRT